MADAGYDPHELLAVMQILKRASGGGRQPEFFSTHPNPENRILHTEMIGEMNGYMHALLIGRPGYDRGESLLKRERAYTQWIDPQ